MSKKVKSEVVGNATVAIKVKVHPLEKRAKELEDAGGEYTRAFVSKARSLMGEVAIAEDNLKAAKKRVKKALKAGETTLETMDENYAAMRAAAKAERKASREVK